MPRAHSLTLSGLALAALAVAPAFAAEPIALGHREEVASKTLGAPRSISVYLPPSYHLDPAARFPLLVAIDGDYHFLYLAGLVEQMATSGEQIPEMIVVGVGETGKDDYRRETAPSLGEDGGDADRLRGFLADELLPELDRRYRTNGYRALLGQSMGGLFAIDTLLAAPDLFDAVFAISPSLWWHDDALVERAKVAFREQPDLAGRLYLSLASERGMGVLDLVADLERSAPPGLVWKYRRFEDENHGSTTIPALQWALREELSGFEMTSPRFRSFAGADALVASYATLAERLGFEPLLPPMMLGNVLYAYESGKREGEVEALARGVAEHFPASVPVLALARAESAMGAARWEEALRHCRAAASRRAFEASWCEARALHGAGRAAEARTAMAEAVAMGERLELRRWRRNQLEADARQIAAASPP